DLSGGSRRDESATTRPQAPETPPAEAATSGGSRRDESVTTHPQPADGGDRIKASPLARRIARERGIELEGLRGTGPEGRIIAEDLERSETRPAEARPA